MRRGLILLLLILGLWLLALPSLTGRVTKASARDDFPCDPVPKEVWLCQRNGGTFNYATCRCEFP
jgi:hypothetical protein